MTPSPTQPLRVRRSIVELQNDYLQGHKKPLEDLMRAWKGIKDLPYDDPNSFFMLGGYHGEPFRGAGYGNGTFWGGYCNHGNVLFPTWHRVYCLKLEEALQSIAGCAEVMLPYWDETATYQNETSEVPTYRAVPWAFTAEQFYLDGQWISNPLRSFKIPLHIADNISDTDSIDQGGGVYGKYKGYETVRYPLSGLVGTPAMQQASEEYNQQFTPERAVAMLNENVLNWLDNNVYDKDGKKKYPIGVAAQFLNCLRAPNYTVFSNTTSAQHWNDIHETNEQIVPLEEPHNHIHLSVGGFQVPPIDATQPPPPTLGIGPNGDMGENDTAAMDPIFFFHHCNVDRVFWLWQKKHAAAGYTDKLDLIEYYPGTNSTDNQGSTPGFPSNMWLTLETPLTPFKKPDGQSYTSLDCVNIETQLGFTYSKGSLEDDDDQHRLSAVANPASAAKTLSVSRINKAPMKGSFVVAAYAQGADGQEQLIGYKAVLNRWDSGSCANCQTHTEVKAFFPVPAELADQNFRIDLIGRPQNTAYLASFAPALFMAEASGPAAVSATEPGSRILEHAIKAVTLTPDQAPGSQRAELAAVAGPAKKQLCKIHLK